MSKDPVLSLLGIAAKAGKVKSGEQACETAVRSGEAKLLILAEDASGNTAKKFRNKCQYYEVPLIERSTREELGRAIGKEPRAVAAVTDEGLADALAGRHSAGR